jgi:hypothetical protein
MKKIYFYKYIFTALHIKDDEVNVVIIIDQSLNSLVKKTI